MAPAILALYTMQPDFDMNEVDIVACRYTFSYLHAFASRTTATFRLDVELIGKTLFIIRRTDSPTEPLPIVEGYGHAFRERSTTWEDDVKESISHQRLVKYSFGSLNCLVRFGSAGYLPKMMVPELEPSLKREHGTSELHDDITVEHRGRRIPQTAIFDLTTHSAPKDSRERNTRVEPGLSRLWITQTPNHIVGFHQEGCFDDVRIKYVSGRVKKWENRNAKKLSRLHATLSHLIRLAKGSDTRKLSVHRESSGNLEIWRHTDETWSALPDYLKERWMPKGGKISFHIKSESPSRDGSCPPVEDLPRRPGPSGFLIF